MLRRTQLALVLVLLMVLAPLASATCGVACLAANQHPPMHAATSQRHCVRATTCCHSSGLAVCSAHNAPEAVAALLNTGANATLDAHALAVLASASPLLSPLTVAAHGIDSSPPGRLRTASLTALRV